ncbi:MAG: RluA family pseudouridine synthase [Thermaerobacter sp.]|nr:RluA family pseudouridine synthase [Thermaerobacter sp.]
MARELSARVPAELAGERLDVTLARLAGISRSQAQAMLRSGSASRADGKRDAALRVAEGDLLVWLEIEPVHLHAQPEALPLDLVYEDGDLLVINKRRGVVVHPSAGHATGTVVNAVLHHVAEMPGDPQRPGVVHRLDRDTSGLMVIAKSEAAFRGLQAAIARHDVMRTYDAIVHGLPRDDAGTIDLPLGRDPRARKRITVVAGGRRAVTHFRVRRRFSRESWLRLQLETGRTHQIRVHLRARGWPVVGDPVYGPDEKAAGQLLHAVRLAFRHPVTGVQISLFAPWPDDMRDRLMRLCKGAQVPYEEVLSEIESADH